MAYTREKLIENMAVGREAKRADVAASLVAEYEEIHDGKSVIVQVFRARKAWGVYGMASVGRSSSSQRGAE